MNVHGGVRRVLDVFGLVDRETMSIGLEAVLSLSRSFAFLSLSFSLSRVTMQHAADIIESRSGDITIRSNEVPTTSGPVAPKYTGVVVSPAFLRIHFAFVPSFFTSALFPKTIVIPSNVRPAATANINARASSMPC